ncbi:MAG: hypothetical protein QW701_02430 [Candidatus Nezhaarchaeales archaeon]
MIVISGVTEICRRYFVMNMFDGALAALGIIMGMWISGIENPSIIVRTILSAGLAMFFSGSLGAYLTEKAERERKVRELEETMFQEMKGSIFEKSSRLAVFIVSVIDGISPLIVCTILSMPFVASQVFMLDFTVSVITSMVISIVMLGLLGFFLGRIARNKPVGYILYMVMAGIASAMVIVLLGIYV